jgi:hypothetical protein
LNMKYFSFDKNHIMINNNFIDLFGQKELEDLNLS